MGLAARELVCSAFSPPRLRHQLHCPNPPRLLFDSATLISIYIDEVQSYSVLGGIDEKKKRGKKHKPASCDSAQPVTKEFGRATWTFLHTLGAQAAESLIIGAGAYRLIHNFANS